MKAPSRWDMALAGVLALLAELELHSSYAFDGRVKDGSAFAYGVFPVLLGLALLARKRYPLIVGPLVTALLATEATILTWPNLYTPIVMQVVAVYSLAAYAPSTRSAAVSGLVDLLVGIPIGLADPQDKVGSSVTGVVLSVGVWVAGSVVWRQRHRADRASRERDQARQRAREIAASERARIARELHDVVAHGMSVVVLQARGGRRVLVEDPATAKKVFDDIERVASDCLDEMRRLLGILRGSEPPDAPLAPQPKLQELEGLIAQARASGASIDLVVSGGRRELSPAIELSIYRIVQEALTNSLKHAPGSHAQLEVVFGETAVTVVACDDGPGGTANGHGHGLIGMRERVDLFGGTFDAGGRPEGGFLVRAELPLEATT